MQRETAETIALEALGWLAGNEDLRGVFMGATGSSAADMALRVGEAEYLASVLDFLTMDDAWVVAFCDAHSHSYQIPMLARQVLAGAADTHWT